MQAMEIMIVRFFYDAMMFKEFHDRQGYTIMVINDANATIFCIEIHSLLMLNGGTKPYFVIVQPRKGQTHLDHSE